MTFTFWHSHHDEPPIEVPAIGLTLRVTLPVAAAGGAMTVFETVNRPDFGPPLHRHPEMEIFRVLSGRYLYEIDGSRIIAEAGDTVSVPGGVAHAFVNISDAPASQLVMMVPGLDASAFFLGLAETMKDGAPARDVLAAFGRKWNVEFLGPPLKADHSA